MPGNGRFQGQLMRTTTSWPGQFWILNLEADSRISDVIVGVHGLNTRGEVGGVSTVADTVVRHTKTHFLAQTFPM